MNTTQNTYRIVSGNGALVSGVSEDQASYMAQGIATMSQTTVYVVNDADDCPEMIPVTPEDIEDVSGNPIEYDY